MSELSTTCTPSIATRPSILSRTRKRMLLGTILTCMWDSQTVHGDLIRSMLPQSVRL